MSANEEFLLKVKGELHKYAPGKFRVWGCFSSPRLTFGNLCPAGTGSEGF